MYITPAEIRAIIGSPESDDAILQTLIDGAEAQFATLVGSENILESEKTEFVPYDQNDTFASSGVRFLLQTYNPTSITSINGVSIGTHVLQGRKLTLKDSVAPQEFPRGWTILYTSGLASAPADVKAYIRDSVAKSYNQRKAQGISEFRQDLLTVKYAGATGTPQSSSELATLVKKYRIPITHIV